VNDVLNKGNIETTSSNVGSDEDTILGRFESDYQLFGPEGYGSLPIQVLETLSLLQLRV
jgi:hypothetical protein